MSGETASYLRACSPSVADERQLASTRRLYGAQASERIVQSHVAVVGIGGVGSWTAEALVRSGVGAITLIDFDHISASNINRQVHALTSTLGQSKVQAMRDRILAINPATLVHLVDDFVSPDNWPAILPHGVDAVLDCCDQFSAKLAMATWAIQQPKATRIPFVCVGAAGGKRQAQAVELADLVDVSHDPLLAKLRYTLRRQNRANTVKNSVPDQAPRSANAPTRKPLGLTCVFSREAVQAPATTDNSSSQGAGEGLGGSTALNCAGYGSSVTVTATFGLVAAGAIINSLV